MLKITLKQPVAIEEVDEEIVAVAGCNLGFIMPEMPPYVLQVDPGLEMAAQGVQTDDVLVNIDGQDTFSMGMAQAVKLLRTASRLDFKRPQRPPDTDVNMDPPPATATSSSGTAEESLAATVASVTQSLGDDPMQGTSPRADPATSPDGATEPPGAIATAPVAAPTSVAAPAPTAAASAATAPTVMETAAPVDASAPDITTLAPAAPLSKAPAVAAPTHSKASGAAPAAATTPVATTPSLVFPGPGVAAPAPGMIGETCATAMSSKAAAPSGPVGVAPVLRLPPQTAPAAGMGQMVAPKVQNFAVAPPLMNPVFTKASGAPVAGVAVGAPPILAAGKAGKGSKGKGGHVVPPRIIPPRVDGQVAPGHDPNDHREELPKDDDMQGWLDLLRDGYCAQARWQNSQPEPPPFYRAMNFASAPGEKVGEGKYPRDALNIQLQLLLSHRVGPNGGSASGSQAAPAAVGTAQGVGGAPALSGLSPMTS